ncbi:hypothetical protein [Nitrosovibrio sp. Nv4]|uniref:hypothetical protein n=1 Tax=Nitrosovibrio sp. Nv4 TaxID=1945880 RepID=UPI000C7B2B95|nr:hypothetical protein [Nitrosovibrio sp. Nv4]
MMLMGGPAAKRKDFPISLAKRWSDKLNRYREPKGNAVIGVIWERIVFPTRIHQWIIQHKCEPNKLKRPVELNGPANGKRGNNRSTSDRFCTLGVLSITVRQGKNKSLTVTNEQELLPFQPDLQIRY